MISLPNPTLKALPNVLHDQTMPNTLGGLSPAASTARFRAPTATIVAVLAVSSAAALVLALVAAVLGRPA